MSNTIDSRVVEMKFDNKQFESAVQTSLNTLEKLKNSLKLENASRGLNNLQKASDSFSLEGMMASVDSLSKRFSTMGIVGMTVIQNLTTSAMHFAKNMWDNTIGQIKSGGLARAMNIEQAKFQLKGLDVEWNKIEKDISYGVKSTAYGLDAAAKAASQLVASGVQFGEEFGETGNSPMAKALRGISGVAAMTNSSYEEISSIYTTVAGQGKLMTMQLRQLESRGLNAAAQLGKVLGYTEEEIRDFVTSGKIDFQTFSEAMDEAFGEHAKAANETYTGSLSNVRSALSRIGAKVATVYLEKMRNVFVALIPVIDNINEALNPFINLINKGITWASERAVKVLTKFNDALQNIMNPVRNVKKAVDEVKVVVDDVAHVEEMAWKVIRGDYGNGEARKKALTEEGENWALIQNKVNEFLDCPVRHEVEIQNKTIEEQAEAIAEVSNEYANWFYWQRRAQSIWLSFRRTIENIAEGIKRFGKAIGDAFKETNFRPLIHFIDETASSIEKFTQNFKMGEKASNNLKNTFKGLIAILKLLAETFLFVVRAVLILISPIFDLIGAFVGITGELGDFISGEIEAFEAADLFAGVLKRLRKFIEPVRTAVRTLAEGFAKLFKKTEMVKESGGVVQEVFGKITNIFAGLGDALFKFIGWIKDGVLWVKSFVDNNQRLQSIFSAIGRVFKAIGGAIYYVTSNFGEFIAAFWELPAVQKLVEKLWSGLKDIFDLISPYLDTISGEIGKFADKFKEFNAADMDEKLEIINGKLEEFGTNIENAWNKLTSFFETENKFSSFIDLLDKIPETFQKIQSGGLFGDSVRNGISDALDINGAKKNVTGFVDDFKKQLGGLDIGKILGITFGAASITSLLNFAVLESDLSRLAISFKGIGDTIKIGISNLFHLTAKKERFTTSFMKIAIAIGILAASLYYLGEIPADRLEAATNSLLKILGVMALLAAIGSNFSLMFRGSTVFSTATTNSIGLQILGIAASIFILISALKILESLNPEGLMTRIGIVVGLLLTLTFIAGALAQGAPQLSKGGIAILMIALAVRSLAKTLVMLSNADTKDIKKGISSLSTIMLMLTVLTLAASRIKFTSALGVMGLVTSLIILEKALMYIATDFDPDLVLRNLKSFLVIFGTLFLLAGAINMAYGKYSLQAGIAVISMAGALFVIALAMKKLSKISDKDLIRSMNVMKELITTSVMAIGLLEYVNKKGAGEKSLKPFIGFALSIAVLVTALMILTTVKEADLKKATLSLCAVIVSFGAAMYLASKNQFDKKGFGQLVAMAAIAIGLAFMLKMLAAYDWKSLLGAAGAVSGVVLALSLAFFVVGKTNPNPTAIVAFLGAVLAVIIIADAIAPLALYDWKSLLAAAGAISMVLLAMAATLGVVALVGMVAPAAAHGILLLDALMLDLGALLDIMGTVFGDDETIANMERGVKVAEVIGDLIGTFIGAIVGGFGEAATNSLPAIGNNLSTFSDNVQGFVNGVKNVDDDVLNGVKNLSTSILNLSDASKSEFFKNKDAVNEFGKNMIRIAFYMTKFDEIFAGKSTNMDRVKMASEAMLAIADFANAIPNQGNSVLKAFVGDNTLSKFGEELEAFKVPFVNWCHAMEFVSPEIIEKSSAAAKTVAEFASEIPNQGKSVLKWLVGDNTLAAFGLELTAFGRKFVTYSKDMENVNPEVVTASSAAAESVAAFANKIPNQGGVLADLMGDNTLSKFGVELVHFGFAFRHYSDIMRGFPTDTVDASIIAAESVAAFADKIPNQGGALAGLIGDNTLRDFGMSLADFGLSFARYSSFVKNVDKDIVDKSISIAESLLALNGEAAEDGSHWWDGLFGKANLVSFGADIELFGQNMAKFYNHVSDISVSKLDAIKRVVTIFSELESSDGDNVKSFAQAINELDGSSLQAFLDTFTDETVISKAITGMFKLIVSSIKSKQETMKYHGQKIGLAFTNGLKQYVQHARTIGSAYVSAFLGGVSDLGQSVYDSGSDTGLGFVRGMESQRQAAVDAAAETGRQAAEALNSAKGIDAGSPSKKTTQSGRWFGEGFIFQIQRMIPTAVKAGEEMGNSTIQAIGETINGIADVLDSDIDLDPTIRPVLDLSDVSDGANRLNAMLSRNRAMSIAVSQERASNNLNTEGSITESPTQNFNFTQNNYSPKALSRIDIYRQTRNQFAQMKGLAGV